ncbi:hypothetical protein [Candidatus Laterigemmans baculatus]|uniref:hypothetical protein n=1 Tax=Candidatus Laterigemmans baculatus TaxID=2770505 RepID=UPI0013DBC1AE|nr:hypothetical protein [Candidatus Laterigemmans baculatus]
MLRTLLPSFFLGSCVFLSCGLIGPGASSPAWGQEPSPASPPAASADADSEATANEDAEAAAVASRVDALIAELGSGSFQTREAATAELLAIGVPALATLSQARKEEDPEVRQRISMISQRLAQDDLEARIEAFLSAAPGASLPGWDYARKQLGDRPVLRELFVEITRKHPKLAASLEGSPRDRTIALQEASTQINMSMIGIASLPNFSDAIALLLAAVAPDTPPTEAVDATILRLFTRRESTVALQDAEVSNPLRRLLGQWIPQVTKPRRAEAMFFSMQWNIDEGLLLATQTIREADDIETLEFALQTVARFGSPSDALMLKPLLDDERPAGYASLDLSGRPLRTQVGDVAMAAIGVINGRKLRDLGFPMAETHPQVGFNVETLGFPIGEAGNEARARVREEIAPLVQAVERKEDIVPRAERAK